MSTTWTEEQLDAIEKTGTNIIVSAGAGSGKTTVLTERVIRKLKQGVDINKLLILTFTDAASQEMKERIRDAIKEDGTLDKQLDLLTTAYICTFDSFSLLMVKKYHYLLNIDSNVNVMDGNINQLEISKIIDDIFNELYENEDEDFCNLINEWCVKDDNNIKKGILSLYEKINLLVEKEEYLNNYLANSFTNEKMENHYALYIETIKQMIKQYITICDQFTQYMKQKGITEYNFLREKLMGIVLGYNDIKQFNDEVSLPNLYQAPEDVKKAKTNSKILRDKIVKLTNFETKEQLFEKVYSTIPHQKVIIKIIKQLDERITIFKKQCNTYTFMDIAKMAIQIVKENEVIKNELKYSLNEIMIDEYQDTSDIQEYFINLISNNNVYMVGDIKQSIYRFRNANPYLFQSKYDNYGKHNGGIKIDLTNNFRSRLEVVKDINDIFCEIMTQNNGGAEYQKDHIMQHGNKSYNKVAQNQKHSADLLLYNQDEQKRIKDEEIEAFIIASDIKQKVENHYQVMDKKTKQSRDARYDDFVILLSKSKHFEMYKKVFNYFQIPLNIFKNEEIKEDYDILVIHNILKLIITKNFNDFQTEEKYALISILRSYLMNYSDEQIFDMFYNNDFYNNEAYLLIQDIRKYKDIYSINEILQLIDEKFNILLKSKLTKDIKKVLVHLEYLSNLSNSLSDLGYTLEDYTNYLDEVFENELKIEYQNKLQTVENAVKIMTIHKSKGLEFGICYFPTLSSSFNLADSKKEFVFDNNLGIIIPSINNGKKDTFLKEIYNQKEENETISEQVRVWYVALTRAKEKIIFVSKEENKEVIIKNKSFNDFMNKYFAIHDYINYNEEKINEFIGMNAEIKTLNINDLVNNVNKIVIKDYNIQEKEKLEKNSFSKNINELITNENKQLLKFGTLIHESLERIDFNLKDLSVLDIDEKYYHYILSFLNCDLLKNVSEGKVYKEYQFYDDTNNVTGIIDLMIEYNTHIDIIDYKLKHIDDQGYVKQLTGYKNYIMNKTKKEVNIYLYSVLDKTYKKL